MGFSSSGPAARSPSSPTPRGSKILTEAIAIVDHRVPVLVGVIDIETNRVIDQVKRVSKYDVDALVATAPFYALGGPYENERHFRQIRKCTDLPLFAYDLPVSVHTKLDGNMLMSLGEDGVIPRREGLVGRRRGVQVASA